MAYKTNLTESTTTNFNSMMTNGFGVVTVMNVHVFKARELSYYKNKTAYDIVREAVPEASNSNYICTIDTLKIANVTQEGPTKTVTGGQFSNPLIKFGKSARLEMQDALGKAAAIEALCGGFQEWNDSAGTTLTGLHFGEDFIGPKMLVGESFFIDQKSGKQVPVNIVFYQFLPDSIFNLTQDAEGDATVFDMNGDLLTTVIQVGKDGTINQEHGVFYSIINKTTPVPLYTMASDGKITLGSSVKSATLDGAAVSNGVTALSEGHAGLLKLYSHATTQDSTTLLGQYIITR